MSNKSLFSLIGGGIAVLFALIVVFSSFFTIDSGERGIILRFGKVTDVVSDGLHFKTPFVESIVKVNVRTLKTSADTTASTKDMQNVSTSVAINYHMNADALKSIYTRTGLDVNSVVIDPRIQEVVKAVTAKHSAEELLTERDIVKDEITRELTNQLSAYNIVIEATQITNFEFSKQFESAIEAKTTAEQLALKAQNDLQRIKTEGQQKVVTAQAEAEAIKVSAEAIRQQGGEEYVQLKFIEKWDGKLPVYGEVPKLFKTVNAQ